MVFRQLAALVPLLYPQTCCLCSASAVAESAFCLRCLQAMPWLESGCPRCAIPISGGHLCGQCGQKPLLMQACHAVFHYQPPLDHLLHSMKYANQLWLCHSLGQLLYERVISASWPIPDAVVAIPLHRRRIAMRGFNQAHEIARLVARKLRIPLLHKGFRRIYDTPSQASLPLAKRRMNLRNAFTCPPQSRYSHIAIIDDVMTTGATLNHLASSLLRSGVSRVDAWVIARASLR